MNVGKEFSQKNEEFKELRTRRKDSQTLILHLLLEILN